MKDWEKELDIAEKKLKDSNFRDISEKNCYYCKHIKIYYESVNFCKIHKDSGRSDFGRQTICDLYEI